MPANAIRDELDRRLLDMLAADARQSTVQLSRKLGVPRTTVHERIGRLERLGVIRGYTVVLETPAENCLAQSTILMSIEQRRQQDVVRRLKRFPEVKVCDAINGEFDLMLQIEAPLNEDIDAVIDDIVNIEGVVRCRSFTVLSRKFHRGDSTGVAGILPALMA